MPFPALPGGKAQSNAKPPGDGPDRRHGSAAIVYSRIPGDFPVWTSGFSWARRARWRRSRPPIASLPFFGPTRSLRPPSANIAPPAPVATGFRRERENPVLLEFRQGTESLLELRLTVRDPGQQVEAGALRVRWWQIGARLTTKSNSAAGLCARPLQAGPESGTPWRQPAHLGHEGCWTLLDRLQLSRISAGSPGNAAETASRKTRRATPPGSPPETGAPFRFWGAVIRLFKISRSALNGLRNGIRFNSGSISPLISPRSKRSAPAVRSKPVPPTWPALRSDPREPPAESDSKRQGCSQLANCGASEAETLPVPT